MNETQKRIKAYQAALPGLREKVIAVALLLAMSASMMTSATFAWITLSRSPAVTGMQTTVAANGNLEIALVDSEGNMPDESGTEDSSASQGMVAANTTWGNLINLSDPVYGLDQIALRPALLSDYNRNRYPLYGAQYGTDGRVESMKARYEFATWTETEHGTKYFAAGDASTLGVRAIASVKYSNISGNEAMDEMWANVDSAYARSQNRYLDMIEGRTTVDANGQITCIHALQGMVQTFAQEQVEEYAGSTAVVDYSSYVTYFYRMMEEFMRILDDEGEALLNLANLQAYIHDTSVGTQCFKSLDELETAYKKGTAHLKNTYGIVLNSLTTYFSNRTTLNSDLNGTMKQLSIDCDPATVTNPPVVAWSQISGPVAHLVDINKSTLEGIEIGSMASAGITDLAGILMSSSTKSVVIKGGILKDFEERACAGGEARMADTNVTVQVTIDASAVPTVGGLVGKKTVKARVTTNAPTGTDFTSVIDRMYTSNLDQSNMQGGDAEAKDIYGMAIDLWARTNAADTVLTLEGQTLFEQVPATTKDYNGATTELYVMTIAEEEFDVYKLTEDNQTVWYYADTHVELSEEELQGSTYVRKMDDVVIGYQGENRVWEDWQEMLKAGLIEEDSTTQGSGSCFVFYADPTEQTQILNLLDAFSVAFMDENGALLGTAKLNTEYAYAINGKVTVPLEMLNGAEYFDEDGNRCVGIKAMDPNVATRITAIVYLNGTRLENQNVLASGEIQGQLNIQFGSSVSLTNPKDTELQSQYRTITAEAVSGSQTSNDKSSPIRFDYDGTAKKVTVNLNVSGEQPEKISGFFVRSINDTQGTRGDSVTFESNGDGTWSAVFDLIKPGSYLMRSLIVDGAEYTLDKFPSVEIAGLNIASVTTDLRSGMHMTADSKLPVVVNAVIDTDPELMPAQVRAQFRSEDGKEFNAIMSYNKENNTWTGEANINVSGTYTLEYLVMDGEYTEVPEEFQTTLIISLGMTTQIWTSVYPTNFEFREAVTIPVQAKVRDNAGREIRALEGVELFYHVSSSALDQNGMHAALEWNAATGYYEGEMNLVKAGRYSFNRLQITTDSGSSAISNTTSAPVFVAMPPDPPTYIGYQANEYQVKLDNSAKLTVGLAYADAATIGAKIVNVNNTSESYIVRGELTNNECQTEINGQVVTGKYCNFPVPMNSSGNQNGEWKITELYFQDVFADGQQFDSTEGVIPGTAESGEFYTIDVSRKGGEKGIYAYVVAHMNIALTKDGEAYSGAEFGKDASGNVVGHFMDSYDVEGVTVTVQDWNNRPIEGITGVNWTIEYVSGTSESYGGYTGPNPVTKDVAMTDDGTHKTFTAPKQTFQFAGQYNTKVTVVTETGSHDVLTGDAAPNYSVRSLKPYVKFTATNPTAGDTFTGFNDAVDKAQDRKNTITNDGYNVTVFFKSSTSSCTNSTKANASEVTTTLYDAGSNFSSATCVIDGTGADVSYSYTPSATSSTKTFGSSSGSGKNITLTVVGKDRQAKTLTLVYDNNNYTVNLTTPLTATNEH